MWTEQPLGGPSGRPPRPTCCRCRRCRWVHCVRSGALPRCPAATPPADLPPPSLGLTRARAFTHPPTLTDNHPGQPYQLCVGLLPRQLGVGVKHHHHHFPVLGRERCAPAPPPVSSRPCWVCAWAAPQCRACARARARGACCPHAHPRHPCPALPPSTHLPRQRPRLVTAATPSSRR